jgi:hypothetical protein
VLDDTERRRLEALEHQLKLHDPDLAAVLVWSWRMAGCLPAASLEPPGLMVSIKPGSRHQARHRA